jgi:hypothetical protein
LPLLLADAPASRFMRFADWLYASTKKTHEFAFERLCEHVRAFLTEAAGVDADAATQAVLADYAASGARGKLSFMPSGVRPREGSTSRARMRQARHVTA